MKHVEYPTNVPRMQMGFPVSHSSYWELRLAQTHETNCINALSTYKPYAQEFKTHHTSVHIACAQGKFLSAPCSTGPPKRPPNSNGISSVTFLLTARYSEVHTKIPFGTGGSILNRRSLPQCTYVFKDASSGTIKNLLQSAYICIYLRQ